MVDCIDLRVTGEELGHDQTMHLNFQFAYHLIVGVIFQTSSHAICQVEVFSVIVDPLVNICVSDVIEKRVCV